MKKIFIVLFIFLFLCGIGIYYDASCQKYNKIGEWYLYLDENHKLCKSLKKPKKSVWVFKNRKGHFDGNSYFFSEPVLLEKVKK